MTVRELIYNYHQNTTYSMFRKCSCLTVLAKSPPGTPGVYETLPKIDWSELLLGDLLLIAKVHATPIIPYVVGWLV